MNSSLHPFEHEELMAYLDGELPAERAARVAAHLEQCAECRAWAEKSRALTAQLSAWQVEPAPSSLTEHVTAAIAAEEAKPPSAEGALSWRPPFPQFALPRWVWTAALVTCLVLLVAAVWIPSLLRSRIAANQAPPLARFERGFERGAEEGEPVSQPLCPLRNNTLPLR